MGILDYAGIAAIIAGVISLIGILLSQWINYFENRKNRYTQIITKQTLENMLFVRENSSIVTTLTRPEIIEETKKNSDNTFKERLVRAESNIEHELKYRYLEEKEIINELRELVKTALKYYDCQSSDLEAKLRSMGETYYDMMTLYDYANWLYVKSQANTKAYKKGAPDFYVIYETERHKFENSTKPTSW